MKRARQRMRTITILVGTDDDPQTRRVAATVRGAWAYHRYRSDWFTVTHVPSGRSLNEFCADLTAVDARRIVERLHIDFDHSHWRRKNIDRDVPEDDVYALISAIAQELAGP